MRGRDRVIEKKMRACLCGEAEEENQKNEGRGRTESVTEKRREIERDTQGWGNERKIQFHDMFSLDLSLLTMMCSRVLKLCIGSDR
jgi:ribosomal protein L44E